MKVSLKRWALRWRRKLVREDRKRAKLLAACGALALATAWTSAAEATVVHLEVTPTETLTQSYVFYYNKNSSDPISFLLGMLPGGQTSTFDHDFPFDLPSAFDSSPPFLQYWEPVGYAIVGLRGANGVSVSFSNDLPITTSASWDSLFRPNPGWTEPDFIDTLNLHGEGFADAWVNTVIFVLQPPLGIKLPYGSPATLVNFSDPTFGGTAIATIPEPSTWVLLVTGAGVVALFARKRPLISFDLSRTDRHARELSESLSNG